MNFDFYLILTLQIILKLGETEITTVCFERTSGQLLGRRETVI